MRVAPYEACLVVALAEPTSSGRSPQCTALPGFNTWQYKQHQLQLTAIQTVLVTTHGNTNSTGYNTWQYKQYWLQHMAIQTVLVTTHGNTNSTGYNTWQYKQYWLQHMAIQTALVTKHSNTNSTYSAVVFTVWLYFHSICTYSTVELDT